MVVLDPPAFAKIARVGRVALRGYNEINLRGMRLLEPGGLLLTASCSHHVSKAVFLDMLADAAADSGRRLALRRVVGQAERPPRATDRARDRLHEGRTRGSPGLTPSHRANIPSCTSPASRSAPPTTPDSVAAPPTRDLHQPAVRRALTVVLLVNVAVVVAKTAVGLKTGALTVLGSALESGLDLLNIIIGMTLVTVAARAPDEDHPYGHEKFESLGTLVIVGIPLDLVLRATAARRRAAGSTARRRRPRPRSRWISRVATIGVNAFVVWYERRRGRALGSRSCWPTRRTRAAICTSPALALVSLIRDTGWPRRSRCAAGDHRRRADRAQRLRHPQGLRARAGGSAGGRRGPHPRAGVPSTTRDRRADWCDRARTPSGLLFAEVTIGVAASTSVAEAHAISDAVEAQHHHGSGRGRSHRACRACLTTCGIREGVYLSPGQPSSPTPVSCAIAHSATQYDEEVDAGSRAVQGVAPSQCDPEHW